MFLLNVGIYLRRYYRVDQHRYLHRRENLKSHHLTTLLCDLTIQLFNSLNPTNYLPVSTVPLQAVPLLRRLVVGLSPRRPGFTPMSVHVAFVVDKVALG
jgi:hypothetical protein